METLGNLRRTHYAEQLINETLGKEVTVAGFVARSRNLGNLIFTDVRDVTGIVHAIHRFSLRQDDVAQVLPEGQPDGAGGLRLTEGDGVDAAADRPLCY
ncbi:MAG: hypothetical protein IKV55_02005, partial [Oscillospiraceae bacterium]|nr:hypothetical protein [Oscillospiraceae bacterium]